MSHIKGMKEEINSTIVRYIQEAIREGAPNLFERFLEKCKLFYESPAHSIKEITDKLNTKKRGDILEHFAVMYLEKVRGYEAWLLEDVPVNVLQKVQLTRRDMGIDIVARDIHGDHYAVQVKYRKANKRKSKIVLGWKQLSTFLALASRTGPYKRHIVITNADYVRHAGGKKPQDLSICIGSLRQIKREKWIAIAGIESHIMGKREKLSPNAIRQARIKALSRPQPTQA